MKRISRRELLKRGAAGLGAAVAAPVLLHLGCHGGSGGDDLGGGPDDSPEADVAAETGTPPAARVHAVLAADLADLHGMGMRAAEALGFTGVALAGKTLFLKPNFVALGMEILGCGFDANTGEVTKPELVVGVAEQCLKAGAARVVIGEGSQTASWEWDTVTFVEGSSIEGATEMKTAVERLKTVYGAERVDLVCLNGANEWKVIPSSSTHAAMADGISMGRAMFEADHIVSMPVLKTHQWARMSGAMKNFFGGASIDIHGNGISRCKLHVAYDTATCHGIENAGVSGSFVDMVKWRQDQGYRDYAIVDGTICLEGNGPHKAPVNDGRTIHTKNRNAAGKYFVLASDDLLATDATLARLIGLQPDDIKGIRMARNAGLGVTEDIAIEGAALADLAIPDWLQPDLQPESYFSGFCKV